MKKNKILLIATVVLSVLAIYLISNYSNSTIKGDLKNIAISDTASIQKIFIADKLNRQITLKRINDKWMLNDSINVRTDLIASVLTAIHDVRILAPVAKAAHNNIVKIMAASSVKVEVYVKSYRINLFNKVRFFEYTKLAKSFYVGSPTQDQTGTYMLIEGSDFPIITYIPGFDGTMTSRFVANPDEWKAREMIRYNFDDIQSVSIDYPKNPEKSFVVTRTGRKTFSLKSKDGVSSSAPIDTVKILDFITNFYKINYEEYVGNQLNEFKTDSVKKSTPYNIIKIIDTDNKEKTIKTFLKAYPYDIDQYGVIKEFDLDRLYALFNNDKEFVIIQYFVFDKIFKKYNDFLVSSDSIKSNLKK
ncbi:MAG: DUF4340 domain-containing protein [Bacteroidota bacterium]